MKSPAEILSHPSVPVWVGVLLYLGLVLEGKTPFPLSILIPLLVVLVLWPRRTDHE